MSGKHSFASFRIRIACLKETYFLDFLECTQLEGRDILIVEDVNRILCEFYSQQFIHWGCLDIT